MTWKQALWALAGVFAIVALVVFIPTLLPQLSARLAPPTLRVPVIVPTRSPSPIPTPSVTPTLMPTPLPTLSPLIMPTPPADGISSTFAPNPDRTGWIGSKDLAPHWREVNLHSGVYQGQTLIGLIQFDLRSLAPHSKILYAAFEMTGRNAVFLGATGEWKLELVDARTTLNWDNESYDRIAQAPAVATLGKPLAAQELAAGLTNRFVFTPEQLKLLEEQLELGTINLRVRGPSEGADNLFTWDASPGFSSPILYLVVVPAPFVVVTVTPTPENVFAAATVAVQQTQFAKQFGTPTLFPRSIATATPGSTAKVVVTNTPTPLNAATETFLSTYATAVAVTTGTFTPAPPYWITATPVPPTPENVFAAATVVVQQTQFAKFGTPTLFPRSIATATKVVVTNTPTPLNAATETFLSTYATAVAVTTGTFTPAPPYWITATPLPLVIPGRTGTPLPLLMPGVTGTPMPTATPVPLLVDLASIAKQPLPGQLYNKILFLSGDRGAPAVWVMDPDGSNVGQVTNPGVYSIAAARDAISPNGAFLLYNAFDRDFPDTYQIWILPLYSKEYSAWRLTGNHRGHTFGPAWSPVENKFAFTNGENGTDDIWTFDMDTHQTRKLTDSREWYWNQFPSWSPDGKQIVYCSDRDQIGWYTDLWIMNADGGGAFRIGDGSNDVWAPIWIKWKR